MLQSPLMQRSFIAAILVGLTAPVVGTYLVHRRLAMMGDGIGHIALTGVALGWLVGSWMNLAEPETLAIPGAFVIAVLGAVTLEVVRISGKTSSDVALAMLFYGGIAGGVLLIGLAGGTSSQLNSYLFGSISTVTTSDIWSILILAAFILLVGVGLAPALYSVCNDEEFARSTGLPVNLLSLLIALLAAATVAVAMRVVGALLVSALMIVPVAISQILVRSFRSTMVLAMTIGLVTTVVGLTITYFYNLSPGAAIVVLAIAIYAVVFALRPIIERVRGRRRVKVNPLQVMHPEREHMKVTE
ncbi:MAG TPA: metal ABC transporter permease [Actinomyces sp.]|nr:metal ABC transporter permease [Acidobacteriota bacterium]HHT41565.1 metal ABC transporter permease [Actinomyces sp.]